MGSFEQNNVASVYSDLEDNTDFWPQRGYFKQLFEIAYLTHFEGRRFKKPVKVEITYECDGYLAFCEELNLYGTGDTIGDSIKELQYQLKNHYLELKNSMGLLNKDAQRFLEKVDLLLS